MGCCSNVMKGKNDAKNAGFVVNPTRFVRENSSKVLDVYAISRLIGEGTYGKVYLAIKKSTNQQRAIKVINKRSICGTKQRFKFINEISVLKVIDHPNIIKLFEFFEDSQNYYMVTEYLSGGELLDFIINNKLRQEKRTIVYIRQVLESIAYLHSKNIVHRDIKLENLMLETTETNALLKLIDFGTSAIRSPAQKMRKRRGTVSYLAPEVLNNTYTEKCDLWSAGVIMYILLCGKMPFGGNTDEELIECIRRGKYKINGQEWVNVSAEAIDLLKKLLEYDPRQRISAQQALKHEWFTRDLDCQCSEEVTIKVLTNLRNFRAEFKLGKAVMCFIANQLISQAERNELAQAFKALDSNNLGKLSESDLYNACIRVWGERITKEDIASIYREIDIDKSGFIDYSEFIVASMDKEKLLSTERLESAFKAFDKDGSGNITAFEIRDMIDSRNAEDSVWYKIVEEVDSNRDGVIDIKEFKKMMLSYLDQ